MRRRGRMFMLWLLAVTMFAAVPIVQPPDASARRDTTTSRVSVGLDHGCAVTPAGGVECWGDNAFGELGVPGLASSSTPVAAQLPAGWHAVAVAVGEDHTCALLADGGIGCWGRDQFGQLGDGAGDTGPGPVRVALPTHRSAIAVAASPLGTCAVLDDGSVMCWGFQNNGELGQTTNMVPYDLPQWVPMPEGAAAVALDVGPTHGCAVLDTGGVTCWGQNFVGQFGDGTTAPSATTGSASTPISLHGSQRAVSVRTGSNFTCALSEAGVVNCWGANWWGQVGDGTTETRLIPTPVTGIPAGAGMVNISTGYEHACAQLDEVVYCWGFNHLGQLGDGTTNQRTSPVPVTALGDQKATGLAAGGHSACALWDDGRLQCWGGRALASPHTFPSGTRAVQVAAGGNHTCLLNSEGLVWCWGQNLSGQLGRGFESLRELQPAEPVTLPSPGRAKAITSGIDHTCALLVDGKVSCWGSNSSGQLGVGAPGNRSTPSAPINLQGSGRAKAIRAGGSHTCALHTDGTIACWGYNLYGQLGDGGTTNQFATHDVVGMPGGSVAVDVTTGLDHTCALKADGAMVCWGRNGDGQLGDGTTAHRASAVTVSVPAGTRAVAIAAGHFHTCALFGAGTVTCWGSNDWGQLGLDPSTTPLLDSPSGTRSLPGGHPTQALALSAGGAHTCVLLDDGGAACWGYNGTGELGDGTLTRRHTAATVAAQPSGARIRRLSGGSTHHCAVLEDGSVSCWGQNWNGQLGTGDRVDLLSPGRGGNRTLPSDLSAVTSSASVVLSWNEPASPYGPQTWEVEGSTDGITWWPATVSATSPAGTTVSGLTPATAYRFRITSTTPLDSMTLPLPGFVTLAAAVPGTCEGAPDAVFPEGDGSAGHPFRVTTSAQLEAIRLPACLDQHFEQHADITIPPGTAWHRIGTIAAPFTGTYHGDGFTIANVSMSGVVPGVGFFGAVSGATITDMRLENVTVTAPAGSPSRDGRAGVLAGNVSGSTISGITVRNAVVSVIGQSIGGLVGRVNANSAAPTHITQSSANTTVTGSTFVGGLVGSIVSRSSGHVTVSSSFSAGIVSGEQDIGGLIGFVARESTGTVTVEHSYSTAGATAFQLGAGGLIGGVNPWSAGGVAVLRSYARGPVTAAASPGGLVGVLYPNAPTWLVVTDSFWDTAASGQATSVGGTGLSTEAMIRLQTFLDAGWSIAAGSSGGTTWGHCADQYPVLMWQFQYGLVNACPSPSPTPSASPVPPWSTDLINLPTLSPNDDVSAQPRASTDLPTTGQISLLPLRRLVDPDMLKPGATVTFAVDGFTRGDDVMVLVASTPQLLNMTRADGRGSATVTSVIPTNLGVGVHTLAVWAPRTGTGYRQLFEVREPTPAVDDEIMSPVSPVGTLPSTGSDPRTLIVVGWVLCALGWGLRRRWRGEFAHDRSR
jgi:alpha-tubulin suppressor-like RCC1 family protein